MFDIKIPLYKPALIGNEKKYVNECLDAEWISSKGKFVDLFENHFAKYIGVENAISICNGTAALHVALLSLGIKPGDEVIVPTLTYVASVNSITYVGATPVFVDSEPVTWQMDPNDIRKKITKRTRAIMVVHLYGHPCDMGAIMAIAKEFELLVIEDCAEAFGSRYNDQLCGTFGDVATFSFYGNKTMTTGEGGMVITNDHKIAHDAQKIKGQGLAKGREYWHDIIGYNFRMTNICAAIGLAQLENVDHFITKKREIASKYVRSLDGNKTTFLGEAKGAFSTFWMCSILFRTESEKNIARANLMNGGIETRPVFNPIHLMPMYQHLGKDRYPVSYDLSSRGINIPSFPQLTDDEIETICSVINST